MSGVKIGDGSVVAAHALVTRDLEPYGIYGGNPARLISKRFSEESIAYLLGIEWWYWPIEKVRKNVHLLCSGDIDALKKNMVC